MDNSLLIVYFAGRVPPEFLVLILAFGFGHATRSVIVGNQTMIDENFPIRGDAFFIIFKNSPKFEYWEFVSAILGLVRAMER